MLRLTANVMGSEVEQDAIELMADDLMSLPLENIAMGLKRCRSELVSAREFTLNAILVRAGVSVGVAREDAEGIAAWEFIVRFMRTHVEAMPGEDCYRVVEGTGPIQWIDGKATCMRIPVPVLSERIEHAVRICGGWNRLKNFDDEKYEWVKKEFIQAFTLYQQTEKASARLGLRSPVRDMMKQLASGIKVLPPVKLEHQVDPEDELIDPPNEPPIEQPKPRKVIIGDGMSDAEWEARKKLLAEQARRILEFNPSKI